jgi:N-acetylmuramoyl-L-alanine amidase
MIKQILTLMIIRYIRKIRGISEYFPLIIFLLLLVAYSNIAEGKNLSSTGLSTIIIDAGHGGKDPGAVVGKAKEKVIVLDIALRLGKLLKQGLPGVNVIYTRKNDVFIPLFERSAIANKNNANLFISIHANYCSTPSIKGTETYVLGLHRIQDNFDVATKENSVILLEDDYTTRYEGFDPNSAASYIAFELVQDDYVGESVKFAEILQDDFRQQVQRADRDVRQAGFLVLRETAMPSVLIETGYLSNKSEAAYLMTENGRETIASSIFRSIMSYKSRIESRLTLNSNEKKSVATEPAKNESIKNVVPKKLVESEKENTKGNAIQPQKNQKPATDNTINTIEKAGKPEVTYALQIAASRVKLSPSFRLFRGIEKVNEMKIGDYYKYFCMESDSLVKIKQNLQIIQKKIPDAFVVEIKNGEVIPYKASIIRK